MQPPLVVGPDVLSLEGTDLMRTKTATVSEALATKHQLQRERVDNGGT